MRSNNKIHTLVMRKAICGNCNLEQWEFHKTRQEYEDSKCMDCGAKLVVSKLDKDKPDTDSHVDTHA